MPHTGSCLCGQTTIKITSAIENQALCHCIDCRKAGGSAFSTNALMKREEVIIEGPVKVYTTIADTGHEATRTFCTNCGTQICQGSQNSPDMQLVKTGILDDFATIPIGAEVYVKDRCAALKPLVDVAQFTKLPEQPDMMRVFAGVRVEI